MGDEIERPKVSAEVQMQFATLDMVTAVDKKVEKVQGDVQEIRGWLEGDVTPLGIQRPGVLASVAELKKDSRTAKKLLWVLVIAAVSALSSEWFFYLVPPEHHVAPASISQPVRGPR